LNTVCTQVKVVAEVSSNEVQVGQYFRYVISANANGQFQLPDLSNFEVAEAYSSPNYSFSNINGKVTQSVELNYIMTLRPKKIGSFTIKEAKFKHKGKFYSSNTVSIKVTKGSNITAPSDKPMFGRILLNKKSVFIGEPVTVTYKVYCLAPFEDIQSFEPGNFDGFQVKTITDIFKDQKAKLQTEVISGRQYHTLVVRKALLFPLESGEMELSPFKMTAIARVDMFRQYTDDVTSNSPTITVKNLENKPNDFNGAVGTFDIKAEINRKELEAGEAFDLKVVISGKGNIHLIDQPVLNLPDDFEIYGDPEIDDKTKIGSEGASGSIEYSYVVRPNTEGEYTLGPFTLSYFDPKSMRFSNVATDSFNLIVKGGEISVSKKNGANKKVKKTKIESKEDIRHIVKDDISIYSIHNFFYGKNSFWGLLFLPILFSSIFIFFIRKKRNRSDEDIANSNRKHASKMALKVLAKAKTSLKEGNNEQFYEELHLSVIAYLKNKLKLDIADLNKTGISSAFNEKGISKELADGISEILEQCQMARYAPIDEQGNEQLITNAESIINQIQKTVK
jgi:hypothetical protein